MDSDNYYTDVLFDEIDDFITSDHDVLAISRGLSCGDFYNIQPRTKKELNMKIFNNHFLYGGTMFKINKEKFPIRIWTDYFLKMYDDIGLKHVIMESDYKKFSYFPDTKEVSYLSYQYGTDEIVLNYILKYIVTDLDIKYLYFRNNNIMNHMLSRIVMALKFNKNKNNYAATKIPRLNTNNIDDSFRALNKNITYLRMLDIDICLLQFIKDYKKWIKISKDGHALEWYLGHIDGSVKGLNALI